jgi:hypothetical protein
VKAGPGALEGAQELALKARGEELQQAGGDRKVRSSVPTRNFRWHRPSKQAQGSSGDDQQDPDRTRKAGRLTTGRSPTGS